jgi:chorismate mutase
MADEHDIGGRSNRLPQVPVAKPRPQPAAAAAAEPPVDPGVGERQIADYRRRIDQIDDQLTKLLNARSVCAVEIGRLKRRVGLPVYQPEREKWILDRVASNNPGPLDSGAVRRVFERVIDESRRLERLAGEAETPPAAAPADGASEPARPGEAREQREGD